MFYWSSSTITTSTKWQAAPKILIGASLVYTYVYILTHFIRIRLLQLNKGKRRVKLICLKSKYPSFGLCALQHRHREPQSREETQHVFSGLGAFSDRLQSWDAWSQKVNDKNNDRINDYLYSKRWPLLVAFRNLRYLSIFCSEFILEPCLALSKKWKNTWGEAGVFTTVSPKGW